MYLKRKKKRLVAYASNRTYKCQMYMYKYLINVYSFRQFLLFFKHCSFCIYSYTCSFLNIYFCIELYINLNIPILYVCMCIKKTIDNYWYRQIYHIFMFINLLYRKQLTIDIDFVCSWGTHVLIVSYFGYNCLCFFFLNSINNSFKILSIFDWK